MFSASRDIRYYGSLDVESLSDWITRRVAVSNNRIINHQHLQDKIKENKLLAVFVAPRDKADAEFRAYLKSAHALMHMQEIEFAFLFPEDFRNSLANIAGLMETPFYKKNEFGLRVYRRGNIGDYKDLEEGVTAEEMEAFVFKSTFVGTGPDIIREMNPENTMKFFSQTDPGLILFYDP